jgi:hypothetical protein
MEGMRLRNWKISVPYEAKYLHKIPQHIFSCWVYILKIDTLVIKYKIGFHRCG